MSQIQMDQNPMSKNSLQSQSKFSILKNLGDILLVGTITALILGFLARQTVYCEWATHFVTQYVVAICIAITIFIWKKLWIRLILSIILLIYWLAGSLAPLYSTTLSELYRNQNVTSLSVATQTQPLKLLSFNIYSQNIEHDLVMKFLREDANDIVILLEVTPDCKKKLETLLDIYPYQKIIARKDNFGIALLSRIKPVQIEYNNFGTEIPSIISRFQHEGKNFVVIGTHTLPPMDEQCLYERNLQMSNIAQYAQELQTTSKMEVLVVGDLNCTSWSPYFNDWLIMGKLRDSRIGYGVLPSWPNRYFIFWIPIDHCLVSSDVIVHQRQVFSNSYHSDHFPIQLNFSLVK